MNIINKLILRSSLSLQAVSYPILTVVQIGLTNWSEGVDCGHNYITQHHKFVYYFQMVDNIFEWLFLLHSFMFAWLKLKVHLYERLNSTFAMGGRIL